MEVAIDSDQTLSCLRELIAIPSVNPDLNPDEGTGEQAIALFARDWFAARGIPVSLHQVKPGRPNVIADVGSGPVRLVLCGHLDTVGVAGMSIPPFEPKVDGQRVYGRGSYDMKGGVASVMTAAAALQERGALNGAVRVALVVDEEYRSVGANAFVARYPVADGCILTEPTDLKAITAHKGFQWIDITTHGREAHGSRWELGQSAIASMGRVITALATLDDEVLRARTHPVVGPASMHSAIITGGSGISTYAAHCSLQVERRTLPGEDAAEVLREITEAIRGADPGADVLLTFARPPLVVPDGHPLLTALAGAVETELGCKVATAGMAGWTDAAVFGAAGIPALNFGGRGEGAHEKREWVDFDSVLEVARVLVRTAEAIAFGPA